jgi:hypothetical protein
VLVNLWSLRKIGDEGSAGEGECDLSEGLREYNLKVLRYPFSVAGIKLSMLRCSAIAVRLEVCAQVCGAVVQSNRLELKGLKNSAQSPDS